MQGRLGKEVGRAVLLLSPGATTSVGCVSRHPVQTLVWCGRSRESLESSPHPLAGPPQLVSSASLRAPRTMVAAFDYNPRESSPNMDVEVRTLR